MKKNWKLFFLTSPAAPANLFMAIHLFLFNPALLFVTSRTFWNYGFDAYLEVLFPLFVMAYVLFSVPVIWIKREWYRCYASILTGIAFAVWVCVFFVGSKGVANGTTFFLVTQPTQFYTNLFIVAFVGIFFMWVGYHKPKITNTLLFLASIAFSASIIELALTDHKKDFLDYQQSQMELAAFSKQKNVLVILLDSFQSDFFQEILTKKPLWARDFLGFTYYLNAASTAPATMLSIPTIHSGNVYHPGEDLDKFYEKNVEKKSFVKILQTHGYRAMILNPYLGYTPSHVARVNQNYLSCTRFGALCEAQQLLNYSLFNSVPHLFKKYIYNQGHWLLSQFFPPSEVVSNNVLAALASHVVTDSPAPTIKFLHLYGSHAPAVLDQSCQLLNEAVWNRKAAINQAQCAMEHVIKVLQALKQHAIYNQTTILIIADHGAGMPSTINETMLGASGNPLFLFKPFNNTADLNYSKDHVSLLDIKAMVCEATQDCLIKTKANHLASTLKNRHSLPFNDYLRTTIGKNLIIRAQPYEIYGSPREAPSWVKLPPTEGYVVNGGKKLQING